MRSSLFLTHDDPDSAMITELVVMDYECLQQCRQFFSEFLREKEMDRYDVVFIPVFPLSIIQSRGSANHIHTLFTKSKESTFTPVYHFTIHGVTFLKWTLRVYRWNTHYDWAWRDLFPNMSISGFASIFVWFQTIENAFQKRSLPKELFDAIMSFV